MVVTIKFSFTIYISSFSELYYKVKFQQQTLSHPQSIIQLLILTLMRVLIQLLDVYNVTENYENVCCATSKYRKFTYNFSSPFLKLVNSRMSLSLCICKLNVLLKFHEKFTISHAKMHTSR